MKRKLFHYLIQYILLPAILIGSDIFIGVFSHFGGSVGFENIFSVDHILYYVSNHTNELMIIVMIAISVSLIVEYLIRSIEGKK